MLRGECKTTIGGAPFWATRSVRDLFKRALGHGSVERARVDSSRSD